MSDKQKKRYYWLKLKEDFFEEDTIEWLEEQPNGKEYCLFYLKLCLKSLKTEGLLVRNVGNLMIPYDPESLARLTNSNADTVKVAMDLFNKIGLIKILDGGEIFMNQLSELVGSETESARQKRIQRAREDNVHALSGKGRLEKELEKEKELEIDSSSSGIDINSKNSAVSHWLNQVNPTEAPTILESIRFWVQDFNGQEQIVIAAIDEMLKNGARSYNYLNKVLKDWESKKLDSVEKVTNFLQGSYSNKTKKSSKKLEYEDLSEYDDLPV